MKRLMIVFVALLVVIVVTGCKVKQDKIIQEMEKTSKEMNKQLDETDWKTGPGDDKGSDKGDTSVNEWLEEYEEVVVSYEKKAVKKALTTKDLIDINAKLAELSKKADESEGWLPSQAERLRKLSTRLTAVLQQFKG